MTRIRHEFPRRTEVRDEWIELHDGVRLFARIVLPVDAAADPVPALLEYLPYRIVDGTALRDAKHHPWYAGHGYASVRVDQRGSGNSEGLLLDEYLPQEQLDAIEVIAWLAAQPWCTGAVGMFGISWGGFNGLQVAARRPPALKAVVSLCSTDDRYADDVHYMGGCVLGADALNWASVMLGLNALPPTRSRSATAGARAGSSGSRARRPSSRPGSRTSAATRSGSRGRSARTSRRSAAPCTWSAAGPTATRTRSRARSRGSRPPARPARV